MRLLLDDRHLTVEGHGGPLEVEGGSFGPLQMLAASLALCTASVVHAYGETARLDLHDLRVHVEWEFADDPYRVERYEVTLEVPDSVPQGRHAALARAADTCTVHNTLTHPPQLSTRVTTRTAVSSANGAAHHHHH